MSTSDAIAHSAQRREYTTHTGFFVQDAGTAPGEWGTALPPRFGLAGAGASWPAFAQALRALNAAAPPGTAYKAFVLARHGEGYHNVAEAKYGTKLWEEHYALLNGDDEITWGPDPSITPTGEAQARAANALWVHELARGMPRPRTHYASPLRRALQTAQITFAGVYGAAEQPARVILENAREEYGAHTCDRRRTKAAIGAAFPEYAFEEGFAEADALWRADARESTAHVARRARAVLDFAFAHAPGEDVIAITAHSGFINGFLAAAAHRPYNLPTGGVIPVVVVGTLQT